MRIQHNTSYEISTSKNIWDYDLTLTYYFHIIIHGKRESITLSLHRNGVLKGLKRLTRVQCSWLCIFPSTIFGNPRCRINNKLARVSRFFVHFFAVTARLHYMKLPNNLTFSGRQKHTTTTFCLFFWTLIQSLEFNSRKICWHSTKRTRWNMRDTSIGHFPRIGHFPDPKTLTFKMKPSAQPFLVEMSFICMRMKNHFHIKGWAPSLVLKQRPRGTQKWPIHFFSVVFVAVKFDWSDRSFLPVLKNGTLKMNIHEHRTKQIYATRLSLSLSLIILFTNVQNKNIYTYIKVQ